MMTYKQHSNPTPKPKQEGVKERDWNAYSFAGYTWLSLRTKKNPGGLLAGVKASGSDQRSQAIIDELTCVPPCSCWLPPKQTPPAVHM